MKKILLIQLFSNGDCLYATTIARQIKNDFPDCHLTWAIADYCKAIIYNNPHIDDILIVENINFANWQTNMELLKDKIQLWKTEFNFDEIFFPQLIGNGLANYDQCIRSSIFRGYNRSITVEIEPQMFLVKDEIECVQEFVAQNKLNSYDHVILIEFSPRSGQANFSKEAALNLSDKITSKYNAAVILSSNTNFHSFNNSIIDGSVLSLRETAYLSNYCTLLIGCSSGITWATTSSAGKKLPMLQILDPNAYWLNSVVNDHLHFGISVDHIIEIVDSDPYLPWICTESILNAGFAEAKRKYHRPFKIKFRITRGIIGYFLSQGKIKYALKHIRINLLNYGPNLFLVKAIFLGLTLFPVTNMVNKLKKGKPNNKAAK